MVINKNAKVWGWGEPHEEIRILFKGYEENVRADENGRFETTLKTDEYGGPYNLIIGDVTITDVYVGHVWLCGGQSNIEAPILHSRMQLNEYIKEDLNIHAFQVEKGMKFDSPADDVTGDWKTATTENLDYMYAVPYFFARELQQSEFFLNKNIPIGLLSVPAGGTSIEGWLPEELVEPFPYYYNKLLEVKEPGFVDNILKENEKRTQDWKNELASKDIGLAEKWYDNDYDDSEWEARLLLDSSNLSAHGSFWLRKTFSLSEDISNPVLLFTGAVNVVKVYINGHEVITMGYNQSHCDSFIPDGLLKKGENTITVRMEGNSSNHRFTPGKKYMIQFDGGQVDLSSRWKWRSGGIMPYCEPVPWYYDRPTGVYNHLMAPVLGYTVDGLIWYQGESNTGKPDDYKELFTVFTNHMREHFGENIPIIFTQLTNYVDPTGSFQDNIPGGNWAELREQQRKCLEIPNSAMAVTIDCGEWNDLHPYDKKTVGDRLALHARKMVYGEDIVSDGPMVTKVMCKDNVLTIFFNHAVGLWAKDSHPLFDICFEENNICYTRRLYGKIHGETIIITLPENSAPKKVSFGWLDCPAITLYNAHMLPASPFEIDISIQSSRD